MPRMKPPPSSAPASEFTSDAILQFSTEGRKSCAGPFTQGSANGVQTSTGTSKEKSKPKAIPGLVSKSGSSLVSASVKMRPINKKDRVHNLIAPAIGNGIRSHVPRQFTGLSHNSGKA